MLPGLSDDEILLLELILIPAIFSTISFLICEYGLFGKKKWKSMSDTARSLSLFLPISMFLYLYFWTYLLQYPVHGMKLISIPVNLAGFFCSVFLLRDYLHGKRRSGSVNLLLLWMTFMAVVLLSLWISTILHAVKGIDLYRLYLSETHTLERGWTFVFCFGLLTPILYIVGVIYKDPPFLLSEVIELKDKNQSDLRTLLSLGISLYSVIPLFGNPAFAPIGLLLSFLNVLKVRNLGNAISLAIGLLGTILLMWWLLF